MPGPEARLKSHLLDSFCRQTAKTGDTKRAPKDSRHEEHFTPATHATKQLNAKQRHHDSPTPSKRSRT
eukprot:scaffold3701_cov192-Alexandrium_tamarense.AAC.19